MKKETVSSIEVKTIREIFDPFWLFGWKVAPDEDGLLCVEVSYLEDGKVHQNMRLPPDYARAVAKAMIACADEITQIDNN